MLHGADYDLRVLHRDFGITIAGLFDTMIAARMIGETAFGLAALLDKHLGVRVDKKYQRADWTRRPLTPEMRDYAAGDTSHLEELTGILEKRLKELGRESWADEEFRRLEQVRWSQAADHPDAYLKVKKSSGLSARELAIVRELFQLRERLARERDRPPFKIFGDDVIVEAARRRPTTPEALSRIPRLPGGLARGRGVGGVLKAIQRGLDLPDGDLPLPCRPGPKRLSRESEAQVRKLARRRDAIAAPLKLEASLLASKSVLIEVQRRLDEGDDPRETPDLREWQANLLFPAILESGG